MLLTETLEGVTDAGRSPSAKKATGAILLKGDPEAIENALVLRRICLNAALHEIKWGDGSVGDATWQNTSKTTECVVLARAIRDLISGGGRR